ncbi:MAG: CPBP family intramembrane glutamic endopeptidase [Pseudomonadota bacterium]
MGSTIGPINKTLLKQPLSHRRLQRDKDFTGDRLSTFRQVFLRHGLPGAVLALACLGVPDLQAVFFESLDRGLAYPLRYGLFFMLILSALNAYAWLIDRRLDLQRLGWMLYLGALSFWEEWVFRIAIPEILEGWGASLWWASVLSALVFGGAHYFTLRWKLRWCVGAFIGGLILSRQMHLHNDLLLIAAFHWIATYLNTPRPPGRSSESERP